LYHQLQIFRHQTHISQRKLVDKSVANYILELARVPCFESFPEIIATFSRTELDDIAIELKDILHANIEMQTTGDINRVPKDIAQRVKNAVRLGNRFLMQSAAVVIMTLAVATQPGFNIFRNAHAVMLEEAEHAKCLDTMVMASHYSFAHVHMLVGCWL
jgi:hypothetical protein